MSEKKEATGWDALTVLALPALCVFQGYVVMRLWAWHVVPVFGGPYLSLGHSVGLMTIFGLAKARSRPDDGKSASETFMISALLYALSLFIGWCAR